MDLIVPSGKVYLGSVKNMNKQYFILRCYLSIIHSVLYLDTLFSLNYQICFYTTCILIEGNINGSNWPGIYAYI